MTNYMKDLWSNLQRWSPRGRPWLQGVLDDTFSSPWPWPRSLKSSKIALSSARGQHYFLTVKICCKTPQASRKICDHLFCFSLFEHWRSQGRQGARAPLQSKFRQ